MSGLATEQAKGDGTDPLGLYVHVPFCASTCDFCAFYQVQPTAKSIDEFLSGIAREQELVAWERPVSTVFWGGGTPGLLSPLALERLGELTRSRFAGTPTEWTVEMAPASVTLPRLQVLKDLGVTRISLGVQSFQPALLEALGRMHTRDQVLRAYERIRSVGFPSVNLDLMFALPGQSAEEWAGDVDQAVSLAPDHLSTYCLTFEEDTALWVKLSQGRVKLDPEHEARLYEETWDRLGVAGFEQYEVSNFARPGHRCAHNLATWRMHEWVGLGPSGASQQAGIRGANLSDLSGWITHLSEGRRVTEDRVTLTPELLAEDAFIFGLRMNDGVLITPWKHRAPEVPWSEVDSVLEQLVSDELVSISDDRVRLTRRGRLLADSIGAALMGAFTSNAPRSAS